MPYYKDMNDKRTRSDKRHTAEGRGGFEDEGSMYSGSRSRGGSRGGRSGGDGQSRYGNRSGDTRQPSRGGDNRGTGREPGRPAAQGPGRYSRPGDRNTDRPAAQGRYNRPGDRDMDRPAQGRYNRPGDRDTDRPAAQGRYNRPGDRGADRPAQGRYGRSDNRGGNRQSRDAGEFRFIQTNQPSYRDRGSNVSPRPYDEQRRERRDVAPRDYNAYRYDAPARPQRPAYEQPVEETVPEENLLSGRNPIREALKSGRDIEKLMVARGELSGSAREIVAMAKEKHIPVQEVDRVRLDAITPHHQGMLAYASAYQYHTVDDMLALAQERGEEPFLVLLDGITDPHNLGAIIRTAECAGAHGVIVQERRAVGLTPAAVKASAGAVEHMMVARVVNLGSTIDMLKRRNVWAYAADMSGEDYISVDFKGGVALVIGAEGEGVSRLVLEKCDKRVALPIRGKLDSLNASVAAGVLLYAVMRSR